MLARINRVQITKYENAKDINDIQNYTGKNVNNYSTQIL